MKRKETSNNQFNLTIPVVLVYVARYARLRSNRANDALQFKQMSG